MSVDSETYKRVAFLSSTIPLSVVEHFIERSGLPPKQAAAHIFELARFLLACSESGTQLVPSVDVDEAWHSFLLFTKEYSAWCENNLGVFVHHAPLDREDREYAQRYYQESLALISSRYGINLDVWQRGAWSRCDP